MRDELFFKPNFIQCCYLLFIEKVLFIFNLFDLLHDLRSWRAVILILLLSLICLI